MGRKPLPEGERKINFTIRIREKLVLEVRKINNYTLEIEEAIEKIVYKEKSRKN